MSARALVLTVLAVLVLCSGVSAGHHPLAELYDRNRTITLKGTVTAVEWVNPHAVLVVAVGDRGGKAQTWRVELDPPGYLQRRNWPRDRVTAGAAISVIAYPSLDNGRAAVAREVTLASGETLVATTDASWNWRRASPR